MSRAGIAAVALTAAVLCACGVPLDDAPRAVTGDVGASGQSDQPTVSGTNGERAVLFFVRAGGLVAVSQRISDNQPSTVLEALFTMRPGGSGSDRLISQIPNGTRLLDSRVRGGVLDMNLSTEFNGINGPALQLAVGQIVLSVTALRDITNVTFRIDGREATVSSPNGDSREVGACDFVSLLAPPENATPLSTTTTGTGAATGVQGDAAVAASTTSLPTDPESAQRERLVAQCG